MSTAYDHYGPSCDLVPGTVGRTRGWYLIAANGRVEAGAFATERDAREAAEWMEQWSRGVHPGPWRPVWARQGLLVGTRQKANRKSLPPPLTG